MHDVVVLDDKVEPNQRDGHDAQDAYCHADGLAPLYGCQVGAHDGEVKLCRTVDLAHQSQRKDHSERMKEQKHELNHSDILFFRPVFTRQVNASLETQQNNLKHRK